MKDLLKKIWAWIVSIPQDKLLHDYAGALITLYSFVILWLLLPFWPAAILANVTALLALIGKEVYDYLKPEGHSVEAADIAYGVFGMAKVDIALLVLFIGIACRA